MSRDRKSNSFWHQPPHCPDCLVLLANQHIQAMLTEGRAHHTIESHRQRLRYFLQWCHQQEIHGSSQLSKGLLETFSSHLSQATSPRTKRPYTKETRQRIWAAVLDFFCWLPENHSLDQKETLSRRPSLVKSFWEQAAVSPDCLVSLGKQHLQAMFSQGFSPSTLENRRHYLRYFIGWCHRQEIHGSSQLSKGLLETFHNHLSQTSKPTSERPFAFQTRYRIWIAVTDFFCWLSENHFLRQKETLVRRPSLVKSFWEQPPVCPDALVSLASQYLQTMPLAGASPKTIQDRQQHLRYFITWCQQREIFGASQVSKTAIERYQNYLYRLVSPRTRQPLAAQTRKHLLISVSKFFDWLTQHHYLPYTPVVAIDLPRLPKRLPRYVLTAQEVRLVLEQPDTAQHTGIRDRAILETLYATAMRRQELANLTIEDLALIQGIIKISGQQGRWVPLTPSAILWLQEYVQQVRPIFSSSSQQKALFLNPTGSPIEAPWLGAIVRRYVKATHLQKTGSCQLFRHTVATLMVENGADIRYLQELLGHKHLDSTQIYTRVSISKLKEIHSRTHPAKMHPPKREGTISRLKTDGS